MPEGSIFNSSAYLNQDPYNFLAQASYFLEDYCPSFANDGSGGNTPFDGVCNILYWDNVDGTPDCTWVEVNACSEVGIYRQMDTNFLNYDDDGFYESDAWYGGKQTCNDIVGCSWDTTNQTCEEGGLPHDCFIKGLYWPESPSSTHELVARTTLHGYPCRTNTESYYDIISQGQYNSGDDEVGTIEDPNSGQLLAYKENFACPEVYNTYSNKQYNTFDPEDSHTYIHIRGYSNNDEKHICPLQLETIERAIHLYTNKGDIVLDCFSGSGSTMVAAARTGRKFVGSEISKEYYDKSLERLDFLSNIS